MEPKVVTYSVDSFYPSGLAKSAYHTKEKYVNNASQGSPISLVSVTVSLSEN